MAPAQRYTGLYIGRGVRYAVSCCSSDTITTVADCDDDDDAGGFDVIAARPQHLLLSNVGP